jgi:hypothetical protein
MSGEATPSESTSTARLRQATGYRVEAAGDDLGIVHGVPQAGRPPRPLVLVVFDGTTVRFVSVRRVAAVEPLERRIDLHPDRSTTGRGDGGQPDRRPARRIRASTTASLCSVSRAP